MRMIAEYDNYRRRTAKEKDGIYADAYADALKGILPILDNLERAVGVGEAEALQKGLAMTLKGAEDALAKMGVTAFGEKGETFDPEKHNAVMHIEDEQYSEGEITEVYQKGYAKGDKILRFAMVIVAN
jgi:molecular chaperone GrpE